jgi:N-acyl-D-amino-acid deacylase
MDMKDVRAILKHPKTMVGSDGLPHDVAPHPRLWGSFPKVLGRLVREDGILSLEEAIYKMTSLPAEQFQLEDRGRITVGAWADLVIFDSRRVLDIASYSFPEQAPCGIEWVIVNGSIKVNREYVLPEPTGSLIRRK